MINIGNAELNSSRFKLIKTLQQWLYIQDIQAIDILYGVVISHYLPGEPLWLFLIGPPGGTKTELLRSFQGEPFYSMSTLTPQTLISGLHIEKKVDLLPDLDGKILIVKDFTTILARDSKEQAQIFADLRDCYDGYMEKVFGSGVGKKGYKAKFEIIAGVTPAIDMYRTIHGILGERFFKCRIHTDEAKAIDKAAQLMGKESEMRMALATAASECICYYSERIKQKPIPNYNSSIFNQIKALGNITAKLRSEVARDRYHTVLYHPEAEIGTRLTKQLLKLAQAVALFHEHECIGQDEMQSLVRVARDSIPRQRFAVVKALAENESYLDTVNIGQISNTPTPTAKEILEELWMLDLVERKGSGSFEWRLNDKTRDIIAKSGTITI
ncbi:hypothetical protein ACFLXL_02320 [Chloroflexota bacterium]